MAVPWTEDVPSNTSGRGGGTAVNFYELRDMLAAAPNGLWVADITHLRTWEGWLYLAAVQDAYSCRIVGWSMNSHMRAELVVDALQTALQRRRPGPGRVHHSDQGSQIRQLGLRSESTRRRHRRLHGDGSYFQAAGGAARLAGPVNSDVSRLSTEYFRWAATAKRR